MSAPPAAGGFTATQLGELSDVLNISVADLSIFGDTTGGIFGTVWRGHPRWPFPPAAITYALKHADILAATAGFVAAFANTAFSDYPYPTLVMQQWSPAVRAVLDAATAAFDNPHDPGYIAAVMWAIRTYMDVFDTWSGAVGFEVAQWTQYRVLALQARDNDLQAKIDWVEHRTTDAEANIRALWQMSQKLDWVEHRMTATEAAVKNIWQYDLPYLQQQQSEIWSVIRNELSPTVRLHTQQLGNLIANAIPAIQGQVAGLTASVADIRATYATKADLEQVRQELLRCCRANQQAIAALQASQANILTTLGQIIPLIQALQNQVRALEERIPTLATLADVARLQGQIDRLIQQASGFATLSQLAQLQGQVTAIQNRLPDYDAALATMRAHLDALDRLVAQKADQAAIDALQKQITALWGVIQTLAPLSQLQQLQARVAELESALPAFVRQTEFEALKGQVSQLVQRASATDAAVATLQQHLDALAAQVQGKADISQVVFLQRQIADLLATDTAQWQALRALGDQLANAQQAIVQLGQRLQQLQDQVVQLGTQVGQQLQQIQAVAAQMQSDIDAINQGLRQQVMPQIANLLQRVAVLEQQKTGTVLPALQNLAKSILFLDNQLTQEVKPTLGQHGRQIEALQRQIADILDKLLPRLDDRITQVTNVFNTQIVNLTNQVTNIQQTFVTNVINVIIQQIPQICQGVRKCLQDSQQDTCEFGRRVWGRMAECWLSACTPEQPQPYRFSRADSDARWGMIGQLQALSGQGPVASHRGLNNTCHHLLFMMRASQADAPVTLPRITDTAEHIFINTP